MKTISEITGILEENKKGLSTRFKIKELGVFGSYSRGEQQEESDLDILVNFSQPIGLDFVELAMELEGILDIKVDLVSRGAIKSELWKYVEEDLIYV